jgi:3-oxoacyl-[acyl-carrier protein] reductase
MKIVIVTGATRGLGLEIIKELLKNSDYKLIATGRSKSEELIQLEKKNSNLSFYEYDLIKDNPYEFIKNISKQYGHIYGLVNNAAIGKDGVLSTMHDSEISEVINVNLTSTILLTKYVSRSMLLNKEGRIINVSSIIANTGYSGLSVYAASKAGLIGFTKSLARELGKVNITVNAVLPGYMETAMTEGMDKEKLDKIKRRSPLKTLIKTEDVSPIISYLLSDPGIRVTGTSFTIDAGSTC